MESKPSFIGPDCAVELYTVTMIGMIIAFIVLPWHKKADHALRFHHTREEILLLIFGIGGDSRGDHLKPCLHRLQIFFFVLIQLIEPGVNPLRIFVHRVASSNQAVCQHGIGNLQKSGNICSRNEIAGHAVFGCGARDVAV